MTGATRLAAAKKLGWEAIPAVFMDGDETDARLWEIVENLHRNELTVQERAEHIAEWVRLTDAQKPGQVAQVSGGRGKEGGVSAASRELGLERTEVRRAVKIAGITDEAKEAARAAGLSDNQSALLEIAQAAPDQQAAWNKAGRGAAGQGRISQGAVRCGSGNGKSAANLLPYSGMPPCSLGIPPAVAPFPQIGRDCRRGQPVSQGQLRRSGGVFCSAATVSR